ncbi:hypothetical protein [Acinetobacter ursingii]|uniref:hypothetical protein n=1 Tax=Acinetobacter ursingii TaxID=108980 RepID=UPI00069FC83D|nr:hypothetical protein [Acinetobacter ursingii]
MVDLEKERKAFEEQWRLLGGHLLYVEWSTDNMYSLSPAAKVLNKNDQISLFNTINTAWGLWVVQAKQNKTVIDSLKAENEELKTAYSGTNAALLAQLKINSDLHEKLLGVSDGEYVVIKKDDIENWYLDEGEYVWYEKDSIDGYLEDLDNGEVLEVQRKEYVVINSNPVFATNVYEDADNINWELFDSKEEAEKAATHCKAMVEAQGDGDE